MILPGRASQALAIALARATGDELVEVTTERFPDGELIVQVPSTAGERAVIVASTVSDAAFVELLLLQDAAREAGARQLTTVVPYLGYARQDSAFHPGQPVSVRAVARAIGSGTDRVITVDPHTADVVDHFSVEATAISAADRLAEPLPSGLTDPLFLAPDASAIEAATAVRAAYGTGEVDHFEKTRESGREVEVFPSDADPTGRDVVLVDDIVSTGGTMRQAASILRDRDADRIFATCIHPLLTGGARTRLARAGVTELFGTDTIERPESVISVAPAIAPLLEE